MEAEIVSRLPVKSVLRLRCVSKAWRCLIDSEYFTRRHLHHSIRDRAGRGVVIYRYGKTGHGGLKRCDMPALLNGRAAAESRDVRLGGKDWRVVSVDGHCDGLMLLMNSRSRFVLWNPWTGILKQLRKPGRNVSRKYGLPVLGWDESSGEYVACAFKFHSESGLHICSVYRSKRNSWKTVEERWRLKCMDGQAQFVNGTAHWLRTRTSWSSKPPHIVSFDIKNEVFGEVELPFEREPDYYRSYLGVLEQELGGYLCVIVTSHLRMSIWVWKEYGVKESWLKAIDELPFDIVTCAEAPPVPDGEIICTSSMGGFLLYDPTFQVIKHFYHAHICDQTLLNPYRLRLVK